MPKWLIRLKGQAADFRFLASLDAEDWWVFERGDGYYLKSSQFSPLPKADEVWERAKALMRLVNGASLVVRSDFQAIELDYVTLVGEDGIEKRFFFESATESVCARTSAEGMGGIVPSSCKPRLPVNLGSVSDDVKDVLEIFAGANLDPINLYKIYEIIGAEARAGTKKGKNDAIVRAGLTTKTELNRFTRTVNHEKAAGSEARHARSSEPPPPDPMSLPEARTFVQELARRWLESKR